VTPLLICGDQATTSAFTVLWLWSFVVQTAFHKRRLDTYQNVKKLLNIVLGIWRGTKIAVRDPRWDTEVN
jgi:hypothetical protein